jgi:hypothetical protein
MQINRYSNVTKTLIRRVAEFKSCFVKRMCCRNKNMPKCAKTAEFGARRINHLYCILY